MSVLIRYLNLVEKNGCVDNMKEYHGTGKMDGYMRITKHCPPRHYFMTLYYETLSSSMI